MKIHYDYIYPAMKQWMKAVSFKLRYCLQPTLLALTYEVISLPKVFSEEQKLNHKGRKSSERQPVTVLSNLPGL